VDDTRSSTVPAYTLGIALSPGTRLGSYEILSALGAGGMGEVYRAKDSKLKRDVALKVLPADVATDRERLARFQREAEVLASLNHPNIAHIHGLEEAEGVTALVMELVEGEDLSQRIARGAIPIDEALPIAKQIAEALEAAHEQGIIHRDLKPANVKVRPDSTVKVLDFGLAKAIGQDPKASGSQLNSPTITSPAMTMQGVILGTAAYMAPEQARGRFVDRRADIWAFGVVLFEMLTGTRAFRGDDITDTIVAVVSKEPDWSLLPADATAIRPLIARCLKKDPKVRMRDIGEARLQIDELLSGAGTIAAATSSTYTDRSSRRMIPAWLGMMVASVAIVAATIITFMVTRPAPAEPAPTLRFSIQTSTPLFLGSSNRALTVSPDGKYVVFVTARTATVPGQLMIRAFDQMTAVAINGVLDPVSPFFSPDSRWVGYFEGRDIKKVPVAGGSPLVVFSLPGAGTVGGPRGATWNADDTIVFSAGGRVGLRSVPAAGGAAKVLTTPDFAAGQDNHLFPSIVAGGRGVLYSIWPSVGDPELEHVAVLDLATGQSRILIRGGSQAEFVDTSTRSSRDGYLVYAVAGALRAVRFDPVRLEVTGDPVAVLDAITTGGQGSAQYGLSETGTLVYVPGQARGLERARRTITWIDRRGKEEPVAIAPQNYVSVRLSPDGARLALDARDRQSDIWIYELARRTMTRLTLDPAVDGFPVWTPDGRRILFESNRKSTNFQIYSQAADGTGAAEQLTTDSMQRWPFSISPDGRRAILHSETDGSALDTLTLDGQSKPEPLLASPSFTLAHGEVSPDGRWLAYQSNEGGENQIYVRPFPDVNSGRWQVSPAGGIKPVWARNGRELFYLAGRSLMAVPVQTAATFTAGTPIKLFEGPYFVGLGGRSYDVSLDGQRFVVIKETPEEDQPRADTIAIVLNWRDELKRRVAGQ
jgi:serine/threonine protein kinase